MSGVSHIPAPPAPPASRRGRQRSPEIALVGGRSIFSDNLVRATGQGCRDCCLIHVHSIAAFNALLGDDTCWLRVVLIDDATLRHSSMQELSSFSCPDSASLVLAYLDGAAAARLYHAADKPLPFDSYVPVDVRLDVWLSILKLLLHGGRYIHADLQQPRPGANPPPARAALGLTPRQCSVLELVAAGLPNKVIAARLGVSDHTVKLHIHNIIRRLGVSNRTEAAARFYDDQS